MSSVDPSTIQPPLDYSDSGPGIVISVNILAFLASVIVVLRFWARRLPRLPFGLDDYLCLAALITHHVLMAGSCVGVLGGGIGRDMRITATEDPYSVVILFQSLFVGEIAYTYSSPLIKLSVLAFYWRIFPTRTVKLGCKILGSMCIAWCIAITILDFVQCRPLKAFWFTELQALPTTKCLDPILCFLGNSIANTIIDFFTLTLPIHEVTKLHTTTRRKINICCVFLLGGIAFAASLVRTISTAFIYNEGINNFTKQFVVSGVATVVEIYVAVIGACLPTLVPIYRKLRYGDPLKSHPSAPSKGTPVSGSGATSAGKVSHRRQFSEGNGSFERLANSEDALNPAAYRRTYHVNVSSSRGNDGLAYTNTESYPLEGVMVRHDTVWSEYDHNQSAP
ncbi:hypothetical protein DL765_003360 [Monosporascus sp. GIB2]|nr:hypothetical protein DL765_003360 [Monosporascus sp. GIB2]